jgi:ABC-type glycerol-3-phosphate transport system permease component
MNTLTIALIIVLCIAAIVIITSSLINEEKLIKKAEKNMFFHVIAKLTSSRYDGYPMSDEEKKAMEEYLSKPSEYDKHSIGSYFRLCDTLKDTLSTRGNFHNYSLNFNMSEVGTGVLVLVVFAVVVTLGVIYG